MYNSLLVTSSSWLLYMRVQQLMIRVNECETESIIVMVKYLTVAYLEIEVLIIELSLYPSSSPW